MKNKDIYKKSVSELIDNEFRGYSRKWASQRFFDNIIRVVRVFKIAALNQVGNLFRVRVGISSLSTHKHNWVPVTSEPDFRFRIRRSIQNIIFLLHCT